MLLKILPVRSLRGAVDLPASKSYSIRSFFVAACGGVSHLLGMSDCDDARVAGNVARLLGAVVTVVRGGYRVSAGTRARETVRPLKINVRESGTSLRFVLPLLPFLARPSKCAVAAR